MKTELPQQNWHNFYAQNQSGARYPTEWVVRTLAGGNYPSLQMPKHKYAGSRILDLSCGDGRNLPLLLDLQFEVHATEISQPQIDQLVTKASALAWPVNFKVGLNTCQPYPDRHFDFVLACSSIYYLDDHTPWHSVREETARIISDDGWLIGNFPDPENSVLENVDFLSDGSAIIQDDPFAIRNGVRFMVPHDEDDVREFLNPEFEVVSVGHLRENFYGLVVSGFFFVAKKRPTN